MRSAASLDWLVVCYDLDDVSPLFNDIIINLRSQMPLTLMEDLNIAAAKKELGKSGIVRACQLEVMCH